MTRLTFPIATTFVIAAAGVALAGGPAGNPVVKARKAHMTLYQHNVGPLFAMAKGDLEYNADTASTAANNLAALTKLSHRGYWAPGTSTDDLGEETRALPALWEDGSKDGEIGGQLAEAADSLAAVAGDGKEAMVGALGPVGKACGSCHENFRQPR